MRNLCIIGLLSGCAPTVVGDGDLRTEERSLPAVTDLELGGLFTVELVAGPADSATVRCDANLLQHIVTAVEGERLELRVARGVSIAPTGACSVVLTVSTPPTAISVRGAGDLTVAVGLAALRTLDVSGAGNVVLPDDAGTCGLAVDVSGSGDVDLGRLTGDCALEADLSGATTLTAEGDATSLDVDLSGSGTMRLADLTVQSAVVGISGAGGGEITVTESLTARISGAGDLVVFGDPSARDVDTTGAGSVSYE